MTQEILENFSKRRNRQIERWTKYRQLHLHGINSRQDIEKYVTLLCKGCEGIIKAGEDVCQLRIGYGYMYTHDRGDCILKFPKKHPRLAYLVKDWTLTTT